MAGEMGEFVVGAYLKLELDCDFIDYNVRPPGGGLEELEELEELDVVGLNFKTDMAYLCEVTTHIRGAFHSTNEETVARITKKYERQREYARRYLDNFPNTRFMFWLPVVAVGYVTERLSEIEGLELIINGEDRNRVEALQARARREAQETGNPFFRALQILGHMRG